MRSRMRPKYTQNHRDTKPLPKFCEDVNLRQNGEIFLQCGRVNTLARPRDSSGNGRATPAAAATTRSGSAATPSTASVFTVAKAGCGTAYYGMPDAMPLDVVGGIPGRHTAGHCSIAAPSDNSKHSNSKQDCSDLW